MWGLMGPGMRADEPGYAGLGKDTVCNVNVLINDGL